MISLRRKQGGGSPADPAPGPCTGRRDEPGAQLGCSAPGAAGDAIPPLLEKDGAHYLAVARKIYSARRQREQIFGKRLFSDPAWDILLDLFIASSEKRQVSVKRACLAASSPATTALRYIAHLVKIGLVDRKPHPSDLRSVHLSLTPRGRELMLTYLARTAPAPDELPG